ncbi:carnitine O-palmitoyltransferase 2, mitochondrial isoform X2 [Eurosta solidaginis]
MIQWIKLLETYTKHNFAKRLLHTTVCRHLEQAKYQYIQSSELPTLHFQKTLPRLPIPQLNLTCERLLSAVQPLLDEEEYRLTVQNLMEFQKGDGAVLQTYLKNSDKANKHTSYVSKPWFDMYLCDRSPLPINYNPLLIMKSDNRSNQNQILRATNLVISSLRFWRSLQENILEPEMYHLNPTKTDTKSFRNIMRFVPKSLATYGAYAFKVFPLDMSQYNRIFGLSRIPQNDKDILVQHKNSRHILVMRGGNMYAVDVLDNIGNIEPPAVIFERLQTVLQMDEASGTSIIPVGALTSVNRNEWAALRKHLIHNVGGENEVLFEKEIDAALFCLCLDKDNDPMYNEENLAPLLKHLLAGDGKNRWFDKSVSLIVCADGTAALNFEHSWGDGVAVLRYFNDVFKDTLQNSFVTSNVVTANLVNTKSVRPINLKTDKLVQNEVRKAVLKNTHIMDQLNIDLLRHTLINKALCKQHSLSPDAVMQLSFQLAYKRAFNEYVGTYESCSTAAFRHGRTETIRPCTMATKQFCESFMQINQKQLNSSELFNLIKQSSSMHSKLTKEAAMGQGFDRHLFALKHQAIAHNKPLPQIFESKAYKTINNNIISTSTLSSNALLAGSFGPVVQNGLGIAYSMQEDYCGAVVTSYKNHRNGKEFIDNLKIALDEIYCILKNKFN